jgi:hypothetical protein
MHISHLKILEDYERNQKTVFKSIVNLEHHIYKKINFNFKNCHTNRNEIYLIIK